MVIFLPAVYISNVFGVVTMLSFVLPYLCHEAPHTVLCKNCLYLHSKKIIFTWQIISIVCIYQNFKGGKSEWLLNESPQGHLGRLLHWPNQSFFTFNLLASYPLWIGDPKWLLIRHLEFNKSALGHLAAIIGPIIGHWCLSICFLIQWTTIYRYPTVEVQDLNMDDDARLLFQKGG